MVHPWVLAECLQATSAAVCLPDFLCLAGGASAPLMGFCIEEDAVVLPDESTSSSISDNVWDNTLCARLIILMGDCSGLSTRPLCILALPSRAF